MARTLIRNGYVVTVDGSRAVHPGGFVAIDGGRISAVGPAAAAPAPAGFDEVIDATGTVVLPGLINMHQHHWYTLFKGLCDGYLLEDWVTDFMLPVTLRLGSEAMRVSSYIAGMEVFVNGSNLLNEEARPHNSPLKYIAPLPGRGFQVGVTVRL